MGTHTQHGDPQMEGLSQPWGPPQGTRVLVHTLGFPFWGTCTRKMRARRLENQGLSLKGQMYFIESVFSGSGNQNKNKQMDVYQAKKLLQS